MPTYRIAGLTVAAEMELPGVVPLTAPPGEVDVHIRRRPVPDRLEGATIHGPVWEMEGRRFLLRLPAIGRFLAEDGRTLDMEPAPGTDPADAMPFLMGTGFGILLHQRGGMVLHAASVAAEGQAYAICGRSGAGKSTLVAALCQAGCNFVSDDVSAIALDDGGRPVLWPDGRQFKLFEESIAFCDLEEQRRGAVRTGIGKHYVEPPGPAGDGPVPLAAIYILRDQKPPLHAGIERLPPLDAAQALLNESYRPRMVLAMAKTSRQVAMTAAILRHVPVFHLTRPRDLDRLADTVTAVQAHWRGLAG
ncbi:hypothetical protein [Azospirillum sp. sgz301742]